jgi:hypothetical protein
MYAHLHATDDRRNGDMLDQQERKGAQLESQYGVLDLREQMLLALFRRLSVANQDRILRCAEVLSQVPDE